MSLPSNPSAEFVRRNPHLYGAAATAGLIAASKPTPQIHEADINPQLSNSKPERDQAPALVKATGREKEGIPRIAVLFVGHRVRPLDPDNFAGSVKDLLDGLRHAGLIHGDEPWRIKLETEQCKVSRFSEEKTVISLEYYIRSAIDGHE